MKFLNLLGIRRFKRRIRKFYNEKSKIFKLQVKMKKKLTTL